MSNPAFLTDGSGIAPHIPLAKVRKVGLGGETAHVGYFLSLIPIYDLSSHAGGAANTLAGSVTTTLTDI